MFIFLCSYEIWSYGVKRRKKSGYRRKLKREKVVIGGKNERKIW